MTYAELENCLNTYFGNKWTPSELPKGSAYKNEYAILTYISGTPESADNQIHYIMEMYQLTYYSTTFKKNIDDFFKDHNIVFENKRKVWLEDYKVHQNTYDFYITK